MPAATTTKAHVCACGHHLHACRSGACPAAAMGFWGCVTLGLFMSTTSSASSRGAATLVHNLLNIGQPGCPIPAGLVPALAPDVGAAAAAAGEGAAAAAGGGAAADRRWLLPAPSRWVLHMLAAEASVICVRFLSFRQPAQPRVVLQQQLVGPYSDFNSDTMPSRASVRRTSTLACMPQNQHS
jgi:hypothetical protein